MGLLGCAGQSTIGPSGLSYGAPNRGRLVGGVELATRGQGYVLVRPRDPARHREHDYHEQQVEEDRRQAEAEARQRP